MSQAGRVGSKEMQSIPNASGATGYPGASSEVTVPVINSGQEGMTMAVQSPAVDNSHHYWSEMGITELQNGLAWKDS